MNFENRIIALERSLDRQRKIITGLLCLLFAVLGMGATSVVKETVEVTNCLLYTSPSPRDGW